MIESLPQKPAPGVRSAEIFSDIHLVIRRDCNTDPFTIKGRGNDILPVPGTVHPAADRGLCNLLGRVPVIYRLPVAVVRGRRIEIVLEKVFRDSVGVIRSIIFPAGVTGSIFPGLSGSVLPGSHGQNSPVLPYLRYASLQYRRAPDRNVTMPVHGLFSAG